MRRQSVKWVELVWFAAAVLALTPVPMFLKEYFYAGRKYGLAYTEGLDNGHLVVLRPEWLRSMEVVPLLVYPLLFLGIVFVLIGVATRLQLNVWCVDFWVTVFALSVALQVTLTSTDFAQPIYGFLGAVVSAISFRRLVKRKGTESQANSGLNQNPE
jgi:hypothetical protein